MYSDIGIAKEKRSKIKAIFKLKYAIEKNKIKLETIQ